MSEELKLKIKDIYFKSDMSIVIFQEWHDKSDLSIVICKKFLNIYLARCFRIGSWMFQV